MATNEPCIYCGTLTSGVVEITGIPHPISKPVCEKHVEMFRRHIEGMDDERFRLAFGRSRGGRE